MPYYVGNAAGLENGSSPANAAPDMSSVVWADDLEVLFERGYELYLPPLSGRAGIFVPQYDGIKFSHWGSAQAAPILRGDAEYASGWTDEGNDRWSITGPTDAGVVLYNDTPLKFYDHAVTNVYSQLEAADHGYVIDGTGANPTIHVKLPSGANPNNGGVTISGTKIGIESTQSSTVYGIDIDGLEIMGFSRQGINLRNVHDSVVQNVEIHACGGDRTPSYYLGGGCQITIGTKNIEVRDSHIYDVFDSPVSPQIPAGNVGATIEDIRYKRLTIDGGWALAGVEIASWEEDGTIKDILIEDCNITWSSGFASYGDGPRGPLGVIVNALNADAASNSFENIQVRDTTIDGCPSGGFLFYHANISNSRIERTTVKNCGSAGSQFPGGPGTVQQRGGAAFDTGNSIAQEVDFTACEFLDNSTHGIRFDSPNATSAGDIVNNTLVDNGANNFYIEGNNSLPELRNNITVGADVRKIGS